MTKYVTAGTVTALLSVLAIIAGAFGKSALATFLNDPTTSQNVLLIAGSIGTLVSGVLAGVKPAA
jgi:uncharacterized membrane protein